MRKSAFFGMALVVAAMVVAGHAHTILAQGAGGASTRPLRIGLAPDNPPMEARDPNNPEKFQGFVRDVSDVVD